jgi:23S rRNA A1618 N6-methylase RlmF
MSPTLNLISSLINQGLDDRQIYAVLKDLGRAVRCFGSYYTVGSKPAERVYWAVTDNGIRCGYVNK